MKNFLFSLCILTLLTAASACNKDDTPKPVEQELITTVRLTLTKVSDSSIRTFTYKVENGFTDPSGTVQIDTIRLNSNSVYDAVVTLLNEKESPAKDITAEVVSESDDHLFLYTYVAGSGGPSLSISNGNRDGSNEPFNQTFRLTAAGAGLGSLTVSLIHEPTDKYATSTNTAGGKTEVEATFPVRFEP